MSSIGVTVAIPAHNAEEWLATAIESALAQKVPSQLEVRVWDDGSTDESNAVAASYASRISFGKGKNRGGNHARNQLLREARGQWVQFLDADDYLQPHKIGRQLDEAGGEGEVLYSPVLEENWRDGTPAPLREAPLDTARDIFCQWFSWELPQTGAALWRRETLEKIGGWNVSMPCCQEHELYLRAIQAGLRFQFTSTPGAVYRIWSEQTVCRRNPVQLIQVRNALFDQMIEWMIKKELWREEHRRVAGQTCFEMARTWAKHDLDAATAYFHRRKDEGLIQLDGPAAPPRYRYAVRALGFRHAELLVKGLRAVSCRGSAKRGNPVIFEGTKAGGSA